MDIQDNTYKLLAGIHKVANLAVAQILFGADWL